MVAALLVLILNVVLNNYYGMEYSRYTPKITIAKIEIQVVGFSLVVNFDG